MGADDVDATNFGSGGWKETLQGLISTKITGEGQWEAGDAGKVDNALWAELSAGSQSPWTVCPVDAADGALAYFTKAVDTKYALLGARSEERRVGKECSSRWGQDQ